MDLLKKFIQYAIGNIVVLILGFISSPLITRLISPDEMGKFSMFNMFTSLLIIIVTLGVDQSYVRYYYDIEVKERSLLLKVCFRISMIVNLVVSVVMLAMYKYISQYIVNETTLLVVIVIIFHIACSILSRFALLEIRMKQKANIYSLLNIVMKCAYIVFTIVFFLIFKDNYLTLILATVVSNILMGLLAVIIERKEWLSIEKNINLSLRIDKIIRYGIPLVFSLSITWIFQSIDKISIKSFCGFEEIGLYSGAMTIISLLNALQGAFTTFWTPIAFQKYSEDKGSEAKEFFKDINEIVSFVMLIFVVLMVVFKDLIIYLLGEKYRSAVFIFPFLVFMPVMYTVSETTVLGVNFKKKTSKHINISIVAAAFNMAGNYVLVPKFGAKGAAISTGLSYIVFFILRTYYSNKYYKVDFKLKKFFIILFFIYILAIYSSFNTMDWAILGMGTVLMIAIIYLYRNVIAKFIEVIKKKI